MVGLGCRESRGPRGDCHIELQQFLSCRAYYEVECTFSFLGQTSCLGRKKNHLKAVFYSFKDRASLSKQKDLDVDYVAHKPTKSRSRKSSWVQSCTDLLYETSAEPFSFSSPRKQMREDAEVYWEAFGDFGLDAEAAHQPRQMKVCPRTC